MSFSSKDRPGLSWHKASSSMANGQCVEVARCDSIIAVRDSKEPDGPALTYTAGEWVAFVEAVKLGEFDHLAPG
ncbi:DUF397 domain-containing protein [Actinomycetospora sp. TBRC 11914]|uniref:DUF397 domain-containing protein n=1 Tax=Actinomycetospora sp. TBRC 11914 TaxID=2729387 RepID=UPI00145D0407|nr:DUF397 domain-containing protein [Actinomycetospora sp. TBRC 11914]NMO88621.1 DUF397 domain-containing protein [Actinomycetospora sp. TBRC 11914]